MAFSLIGNIRTLKAENPYYFVISSLTLFAFEILLLYGVYHRKHSAYYRRLSQEYKKQFEEEYNYFKDYRATQEDTIRFRHDWKNHMLLLHEMLAKGEYAKAEEYFAGLSGNTPEGSSAFATGCETADMIIGIKSEQMDEQNICFRFKGSLSELNSLERVDCCILLANLLDNAIEANVKMTDNRNITLMGRRNEKMFYLEIKNPCREELKRQEKRIISTKNTDAPSGIGLENINVIVTKYHGECRSFAKNGEYIFQMLLPVE